MRNEAAGLVGKECEKVFLYCGRVAPQWDKNNYLGKQAEAEIQSQEGILLGTIPWLLHPRMRLRWSQCYQIEPYQKDLWACSSTTFCTNFLNRIVPCDLESCAACLQILWPP